MEIQIPEPGFDRTDPTYRKRTAAVVSGLLGVLLMMGFLVFDSGRQIREITAGSTRLRKEYRERDALLDELRTDIYRAGTVVRDYLLDSGGGTPPPSEELAVIRERVDADLTSYAKLALPGERESLGRLRRGADSFFDSLISGLEAGAATSRRGSPLKAIVVPQRNELIHLVDVVNTMALHDMEAGEDRIQMLEASFERRVQIISAIGLVAGCTLVAAVILRQLQLERQAARRFAEVVAARQDLRQLSARLVMVQEEERRNLSRELHDEVGQSMTALLMDVGRLESRIAEHCRPILDSIRSLAQHSVARVRDLSLALRPSMLDELGLVPALHWQAREIERRSDLKVRVVADEFNERTLPDPLRTGIYRIAQEALHNVQKHAWATEARIIVRDDGKALLLSIQDDGKGFDPRVHRGAGLLGIEERVLGLGGSLSVDSRPGAGTHLSVRLPLNGVQDDRTGVA